MVCKQPLALSTVFPQASLCLRSLSFSFCIANFKFFSSKLIANDGRVFQQKFKERLGSQWAHITSQPEVEEAIKQVEDLYIYFERLERIVSRQLEGLQRLNDVETEVSLYYQQEG